MIAALATLSCAPATTRSGLLKNPASVRLARSHRVGGHVGNAALRFALRYLHSSGAASVRSANWLAASAGLRGAGLYVVHEHSVHVHRKMKATTRRPIEVSDQIIAKVEVAKTTRAKRLA